jgi:hypothetical protein
MKVLSTGILHYTGGRQALMFLSALKMEAAVASEISVWTIVLDVISKKTIIFIWYCHT